MERPAPCGSKIVVIHEPWKEPQAARKEPTVSSLHPADEVVHIAFDASTATLVAAILRPGEESATTTRLANDEPSVRRFIRGFPEPERLRTCYEAGPTGYELQRLLGSLGVPCLVVAPSLIPTAPGNRVKTDTRDARHLVRQFRAGELTPIRVPTPAEEAVRDLCRARGDAVEDLTRAKNRLEAFLLRHGRVYRAGSTWTFRHRSWLAAQSFDDPALRITFGRYLATVECREAERAAIEADLAPYLEEAPFAEPVRRLAAYRGVDRLGALVLQAEVGDSAALRLGRRRRGVLRSRALRVLLGRERPPWLAHPCRQRPPAAAARRGRLVLPLRPEPGTCPPAPPAGYPARDSGPCLGRPGRPLPPLPPARREEVRARRGRGGDRAPARGLPPRGDGGLTSFRSLRISSRLRPVQRSSVMRRGAAVAGTLPVRSLRRLVKEAAATQVWGTVLRTADMRGLGPRRRDWRSVGSACSGASRNPRAPPDHRGSHSRRRPRRRGRPSSRVAAGAPPRPRGSSPAPRPEPPDRWSGA